MKFIHSADLHRDSPLIGLSTYAGAPTERLRSATKDAFHNLVTHTIDEQIDGVVITGDVYDGNWKDFSTGLIFVRQMGLFRHKELQFTLIHSSLYVAYLYFLWIIGFRCCAVEFFNYESGI